MTPPANDDAPESPHRIDAATWGALVAELGADRAAAPRKPRSRARPSAPKAPAAEYTQGGQRSAWEIALELAGRLGRPLGDGKFAVLCVTDAAHSNPDRTAEDAQGSCVLLPPAQDSMFGLPKCSHAHCANLTLRQWIAGVGFDTWAEAMLQARGWRRAREFLLHDGGISGWKRIPFLLRDHEDTVEGGPYQVVPDDPEYCDFTARIVADVEEHDVATSRRWYELEATVGGRARRFRVPAGEFASLSWVPAQLGPEAVIAPGRDTAQKLRAGIQYVSKPIPQRDAFTFTGFRQVGGRWVYLHGGGAIGAEGAVEGVAMALRGDVLPRFALPPPPEGEALRRAVRAAADLFQVTAPEVTVPLFGAVWRAPLGPSPLTVYLAAPPETGKSLLAALAQQHFGPAMNENALPSSVKHSTAASVNELRVLVGDAVFTYDDFRVSGSGAEDLRLNEKIDTVVRAQYGGTGAQRLARDGSLASHGAPPRSLLLITGETVPNGHSLRTRLLVVDVRPVAERLDLQKALAAQGVYAQAMAGYVRWLAGRIEELRAQARADALEFAARLVGEGDPSDRTVMLLAEVATGMKYFARYALDVGALTAADVENFREVTWATLRALSTDQRAHRAAQDPALRFVALLGSALGAGCCHVTTDQGAAPENPIAWGWRPAGSSGDATDEPEGSEQLEAFDDHPAGAKAAGKPPRRVVHRPMGDCLGIVRASDGLVWVKADVAFRAVREFAASIGAPLALTAEDLPKRLHEKGLLAKDDVARCNCYTVRGPKAAGYKGGYLCLATSTLGLGEDEGDGALAATGGAAGSGTSSRLPH